MTSAAVLDAKDAEIERLRSTMNDLLGALGLSSTWKNADTSEIVRTLLESLEGMLQLDLVYIRLNSNETGLMNEAALGSSRCPSTDPAEVGALLRKSLGESPEQWPSAARASLSALELKIATVQLGIAGEFGVIAAGSSRDDFPDARDTLLLRVFANQAATALREAQFFREQTFRSVELDQRVSQRTRELTQANAALEQEIAERARVDAALRRSEHQLRAILDGIPGFIALLTSDGRVEAVNRQILEYCGQTLDELRHWGENGTVHPDDIAHVVEIFAPSIASGTPYVIEQRLRRHDGSYRWFDNRGVPVHDEDGQVVRWHVLLTDVDDRKRAEEAVAESERTFRQTFNAIPTLAWCNRTDGSNEFLNQRWHDYTGLTPEEANGWGWQVALHPDDLPYLLTQWRHMLASGEAGELEARLRRHDGEYRWFLFRCDPLRDAAGVILKWYGTNSDIHDFKLAEQALAESERENRQIAHSIAGMVAVFSPEGELNGGNQQLLDYFQLPLEEVANWATNGITHPDDLQHCIDSFMGSIKSGEPYDFETRFRRHDGVYRWFHIRGLPLRDGAGRIVRWYGLLIDVDERRRAEDALAESERTARIIVDTIPGLVVQFKPDGFMYGANAQFLTYLGLTIDEAQQWTTNGAVYPDDVALASVIFGASLQTGEPYEMEIRVRRHDGAYRWFQIRGQAHRDSTGKIAAWYGLLTDIDDRKRAEDGLAESERENRQIAHSIAGMVAVFSSEGELNGGNQRLLDYFQLPLEEIGRWAKNGITHPDDLQHCIDSFMGSVASGEPYDYETRFRRHDGVYRWFQLRGLPLRDGAGRIVRWYGLLTDIDDRKRAEAELLQAYRHLNEAQRLSRTGSFTSDPSRDEHIWSDEFYRICELDRGAVITHESFFDLVVPEDLSTYRAAMERSMRGFDPDFSFRIATASGAIKHLHAVAHRVEEIADRAVYVGAIRDVTEAKLAEDALRRSESFLADGQRISLTGTFSWRMDTDELTFSDQMRRIYEFPPDAPLTFDLITTRIHPEDLPVMAENMAKVRSGQSNPEYDLRLVMDDGRVKHLRIFDRVVSHPDGRLECMGAVQDVTLRRAAEDALDKVRSDLAHVTRVMSLGALTASIAHEVNQPLAGIVTNANTCLRMLATEPPDITGAIETARRTIRDANRASEVVTRLRSLFRKAEFIAEPVDLNEAAQEVIALSVQHLQRRGVVVQTRFGKDLPAVPGDRVQLQQVILNLILNAADALSGVESRLRQVSITTELNMEGVCLSVRDTGIGLPAGDVARIFDAFYSTKKDGMGIGLSVSRSILERHGGRIWATPNDGPGATFAFLIPRPTRDDDTSAAGADLPRT